MIELSCTLLPTVCSTAVREIGTVIQVICNSIAVNIRVAQITNAIVVIIRLTGIGKLLTIV